MTTGPISHCRYQKWTWNFRMPMAAGMALFFTIGTLQAAFFVGEGATSAATLKIPTSARAAALGGAFSSVSGDVSSIEYNPAGLSNLMRTDFLVSYIDYLQDASLQSFAVGFPVVIGNAPLAREIEENVFSEKRMGFGFQYRAFKADDITRSNTGVKGAAFDISDQVISFGAAIPLNRRLSVGLLAKYIGNSIQNKSMNTYAIDSGTQFKLNSRISLGASIQNLGSSKAFIAEKDPLPTVVRMGASWQSKRWLLLAEASEGRDKIVRGSTGAEYEISRHVRLRGGVLHAATLEFSGGLGIRFEGPQKAPVISTPRKRVNTENPARKSLEDLTEPNAPSSGAMSANIFSNIDIGLDYGLSTHQDLGITHTVSLRILY